MSNKNIELLDKKNRIYVKTGLEMSLTAGDSSFCGKCTYVGQIRDQYIVVTPPPDFSAFGSYVSPLKDSLGFSCTCS